jgi:rhodanese-related sulfurtransferase
MNVSLTATVLLIVALCLWTAIWFKRTRDRRRFEQSSITPEALFALMQTNPKLKIFDVRQPLDLLADSEIIPGAQRIPPKEVMANPALIPKEEESVVYCTCPSDKTSQQISDRARALKFFHVKFLRGGLDAWKAKGYPVQPYEHPFHLDTGT